MAWALFRTFLLNLNNVLINTYNRKLQKNWNLNCNKLDLLVIVGLKAIVMVKARNSQKHNLTRFISVNMFQSNYGHILHEINKIHTGRTTNQDKCMYIVFVIFSILHTINHCWHLLHLLLL